MVEKCVGPLGSKETQPISLVRFAENAHEILIKQNSMHLSMYLGLEPKYWYIRTV